MTLKFDIKFDVRTTLDKLKTVQNRVKQLPIDAYNHFVSITPIDSGNARRSTALVNGRQIQANYPYAQRLDQGYSKQARNGMVKPTQKFIDEKIKKITGP